MRRRGGGGCWRRRDATEATLDGNVKAGEYKKRPKRETREQSASWEYCSDMSERGAVLL